jgi:hypothetical protein
MYDERDEGWAKEVAGRIGERAQLVQSVADRLAQPGVPSQVRLAMTVPPPDSIGGSYPSHDDSPNTYWIVFVDGTFPKHAAGDQGHDLLFRQSQYKAIATAHSLRSDGESWVECWTLLFVTFHNGQWWFDSVDSSVSLLPIELKTGIAPGGTADAYKLKWNGSAWVPDAKLISDLAINPEGDTYVSSIATPFEASDIGEKLIIVSGEGFTPGEYTILEVTIVKYRDLMIDADDADKVSSEHEPFDASHVGLQLTFTGGEGFTISTGDDPDPGVHTITDVDENGVATLDGDAGEAGSTGGAATLTPVTKLSESAGEAGSVDGGAIAGVTEVFDMQGKFRALGLDDLGDPITHLRIDSEDAYAVYNDGVAFTEGDIGKTISITDGDGFTTGFYVVLDVEEGWAVLDRDAGDAGSTDGIGSITRTHGARGWVQQDALSGRLQLISITEMAKRVRVVLAANAITPASTTVNVKINRDGYPPLIDSGSMDGGQDPLVASIAAEYDDLAVATGESRKVSSASKVFNDGDVGLVLTITGGHRFVTGTYTIESVTGGVATLDRPCTQSALDLTVPNGANPAVQRTTVGSASVSFADDDEGLSFTITGGTGFNTGLLSISSVTAGVATMSGNVGLSGSKAGAGYFSGLTEGVGSTQKALECVNDGSAYAAGETVTIVWDETNAVYRLPARACRMFTGTTVYASMTVISGLTAIDGIDCLPVTSSSGQWPIATDGYTVDASATGTIIQYADGSLHPLDFPCAAS